MMIARRTLLGSLAALPFASTSAFATAAALHTRIIPGANQAVPVIGVGTSRRYAEVSGEEQLAPLRAAISRFAALGGQVVDTAPSYGMAESVIGQLVEELRLRDKLFLATKVGADSPAEGRAQIEQSFRNLRTKVIDLIAVHNLRDVTNQLAILRELKAAKRIRSLGVTTSNDPQYADFEAMMRREKLDGIQIDYALDNRDAGERVLPLAQEQGVAVMINLPFGRGRLFKAVQGRPLPDWAGELQVRSWPQLFLKYIVSHPAVTCAVPGMARPEYVEDNLGAARGPLPDAALRRRMEAFIDSI